MRKLIASETSSNDRWIPAIVVLSHRHDLGGISALVVPIRRLTQDQFRGHKWSLVINYVSRLEDGQMSPENMVPVACNECCWVRYSWRPYFYNHPKNDTSRRSTTSFNAYFARPGWKQPGSTNLGNNSGWK